MVLMLSCISTVGLLYTCAVFTIYVRHNDDRLIKSTSRELSYLMWTGVVIQYLLVFSVVSTPTAVVCYINYTGFNVSCAVVYAPLLTRTNRIYRLFLGGRRGTSLPRFTSPLSQVVIASLLVSIQVFRIVVLHTLYGYSIVRFYLYIRLYLCHVICLSCSYETPKKTVTEFFFNHPPAASEHVG